MSQVLGRGASSVPRKCIGYQFFDLVGRHCCAPRHQRVLIGVKSSEERGLMLYCTVLEFC